jgi:chromosome segregation ATPase
MVQVDISQLSAECNAWREKLRNYREEFSSDETRLRQVAGKPLTKEQLQDVEHLHNQFHIQLINIHDLKQSIKAHDRKMNFERLAFNGSVNEDSFARHENLFEEYQALEQTLQDLRNEFNAFLERTK